MTPQAVRGGAFVRSRAMIFLGVAIVLLIAGVFGYRAAAHRARLSALSERLSPIVASNRRYLRMSDQLVKTADNLKAQLFATITTDSVPLDNSSAAASVWATRFGRLARHVRDVDDVVAAARRLGDPADAARIRRDTTIASYRRIRLSELVDAFKAIADDYRTNPYAPTGSARQLGAQLGHAAHDLVKSLHTVADDLDRGTVRQAAAAKPLRQEIARLKHSGPFSL